MEQHKEPAMPASSAQKPTDSGDKAVIDELKYFVRHARELDEACNSSALVMEEAVSVSTVDFLKAKLDEAWLKFEDTFESVREEYSENKFMASLQPVYDKRAVMMKKYLRQSATLDNKKENCRTSATTSTQSAQNHFERKIPVAPCDTKIFGGDYSEWPAFKNLFTATYINNSTITPVERLFHLLSKTKGEARQIVEKAPFDDNGFKMAWNGLTNRYENPRYLVNKSLQCLLNVKQCNVDTSATLAELQKTINDCDEMLTNYGVDKWHAFLSHIALANLHPTSRSMWEQTNNDPTTVPLWDKVNAFILHRQKALEATELFSTIPPNDHTSSSTLTSSTVRFNAAQKTTQCKICKANHVVRLCPQFLKQDIKQRFATVKRLNLCTNCLAANHTAVKCPSNFSCNKCKNRHHTLLHRESSETNSYATQVTTAASNTTTPSNQMVDEIPSTSQSVVSCFAKAVKNVILGTAYINIHYKGTKLKARALIDPASEGSFLTERIRRLLHLPLKYVNVDVTGVNGSQTSTIKHMSSFCISSTNCDLLQIQAAALIVPQVTGKLPSHAFNTSQHMLPPLEYADPTFFTPGTIDILIGGDLYPLILRKSAPVDVLGSLVAQETIFGWIITGPIPLAPYDNQHATIVSHFTEVNINDQLSKFWQVEEVPQARILSPDDRACERLYDSTTQRLPNGRYMVHLPFKSPPILSPLGRSRHIAECQYIRNEKSLLRRPGLKAEYDAVLNEYLSLGHMKRVDTPIGIHQHHYYLPHHAIIKPESKTTKVRVVFNASSLSSNKLSLNDVLFTGPSLQQDLTSLILKWRLYKFVFNADIQKMYRQVLLTPNHTPYQRIVFRSSPETEILDYELQTVTFGVNCAPYLAIRTLLRLADDEEKNYPIGAKIIRQSIYVDDVLAGAHTLQNAIKARNEIRDILMSANFPLRKWTANDVHILCGLPKEHLLNDNFLELKEDTTTKTLGLRWNASTDSFYFEVNALPQKAAYTKREVLSTIAKLFDPAGWLAPIVITTKILMQQLWLDKLDWDDTLKPLSTIQWRTFVDNFSQINYIKLPRWIDFSPDATVQIHAFCDASEKAYATAIYVRTICKDVIRSHLLTAKSRVAPIKTISLPRLELCGAVLMAELLDAVLPKLDITNYTLYKWTDSTIVLSWLNKPPCAWKTFVANRVSTIAEKIGVDNWSHIDTHSNPADVATRGLSPAELQKCTMWWQGPSWITLSVDQWPQSSKTSTLHTELEAKRITTHLATSSEYEDILERFSSLTRALHVIAYVFRFFNRTMYKDHPNYHYNNLSISYTELTTVRRRLICLSQRRHFSEEYNRLRQQLPIRKRSRLVTLTPFLDSQHLIRANGRLSSTTQLCYDSRHPIILDHRSHFARLYVQFIHHLSLHGGGQMMSGLIRYEFWILQLKRLLKSCVHNCVVCIRHRHQYHQQQMAALPPERTMLTRPFTHTGLDFAGPFDVKNFTGRYCRITKGYVCLFVCFATKAIHLEAVSELSATAFIAALIRFAGRRGCPAHIHSDNGTNFACAAKILKRDAQAFLSQVRDDTLSRYGHQLIEWHFIPPSAPHMGGLWEAGVKSFKQHFRKMTGQIKHTMEELATLLCRIEACLNSRPLTAMTNDVTDFSALTPGHFLIGTPILTPAEPENSAITLHQRWQRLQVLSQDFCRRWKTEFLNELHKRRKWQSQRDNVSVGDLVILRNEPTFPNEWKLARVTHIHPGKDELVRIVELRTATGTLLRPIHKLVSLPRPTDEP